MRKTALFLYMLLGVFLMPGQSAFASGNISATDKYAWAETSGWINFRPTDAGVMVNQTFLSGYAWAENIGWIKLGADAGGPYGNTSSANWGVNLESGGLLTGYGWSETAGWINFSPTHGGVSFDNISGAMSGYAWAENVGWIHFNHSSPDYGVKTIQHALTFDPGLNGGISCVSAAPDGWDVTCTITPLSEYYILSLSDNGDPVSNPTGSYQITGINLDHTLSATFGEYMVKRIYSGGYAYAKTISEAYGNVTTDWERILLKSYGVFSPMDFNQVKNVILEGGYHSGFSRVEGETSTIPGNMTVTGGEVSADSILIQQ